MIIGLINIDGIPTFTPEQLAGLSSSVAKVSATLLSSGWDSNAYEVSIANLKTDMDVIVTPDPTYISQYTSAGIVCSTVAAGKLTFSCTTTPTTDIGVNILVIGGAATWSST